MATKLKKMTALLLAVAMLMMLNFPSGIFGNIGFGLTANAEDAITFKALDGTEGASGENYDMLVDGNKASGKWCVASFSSAYIVFKASEPIYVNGYTITTGNDNSISKGRNPKDWTLKGCNDYNEATKTGGTWKTIATVVGDTSLEDKNNTDYYFSCTKTTTTYQYFRLDITAIRSGNCMQMSEFTLSYILCEHNLDTTQKLGTIAPTCTKGGYNIYKCKNCNGEIKASNDISALGHNKGTNGKCTRCGIYMIDNDAELKNFAVAVNGGDTSANAILTANITVNKDVLDKNGDCVSDTSGFTVCTPIGSNSKQYTGTFDGQGHIIRGLYFKDKGASYVGLFGYVGSGGSISNVGIIDSYSCGGNYVGGVCGYNEGTIENCYNKGKVYAAANANPYNGGGVCGYNDGTIKNCYNTGKVSDCLQHCNIKARVGGVCGFNNGGIIENCYNTGAINSTDYDVPGVGGVCGYSENSGKIVNCYNTGKVDGGTAHVGGVCGYNGGSGSEVENCYNMGEVIGGGGSDSRSRVGGVCGFNNGSTIKKCYNDGYVNGRSTSSSISAGGVCGTNTDGTIENCYNKKKVSSAGNSVGGVCGSNSTATIINCYNTDVVEGLSSTVKLGSLCGYTIQSTIKNCYNTGTVSGGMFGDNSKSTITNCYYLADSETDGIDGTTYKKSNQFACGEVAYLLNHNDEIGADVWGQKLTSTNKDASPVHIGDVSKTVYKVTFATKSNPTYAVKYANPSGVYELPTAPTASNSNYEFYKWSKSQANYSNTAYDFTASTAVTGDITVYAVSEEKYGATDDTKNVTTTYGTSTTKNLSTYAQYATGTSPAGKFTYTITSGNYTKLGATINGDTLTIPSTAAAGTYTLAIKATEKEPQNISLMSLDLGIEPFTFNVTVTVKKANSSVTDEPTAKTGLVYNGTAQALVTAGTASDGTMKYSLDNSTWSADIPTGTDAKEYTVYYKVVGDSNHNDVDAKNITVTIAKLVENTPNIEIDYANETLTGFENGGSYAIDGTAVEPTNGTLAAESYMGQTISIVKKASDTNHEDSTPQSLIVLSRPTAPTLTIDNSTEKVTIPTDYYYGSTDSNYANITTQGRDEGVTVAPGDSIYIYKAAVTEGENKAFKSAVQTLMASNRATDPEVTVNYAEETLSTSATMQYLKGSTWTACTDNMAATEFDWDGTEDVKVKFRKPATTGNYVSEEVEVTIPKRPDAPNLEIDTSTEKVTIPTDYYYGSTDSNYANITTQGRDEGVTVAPKASIYIHKAAVTEGENKAFKSAVQTLTAPERMPAPEITVNYAEETLSTAETIQYLKGSTWTACTANMAATEFDWDGTENVKVKFRKPATNGNYASEEVEVTIPKRPDAPILKIDTSMEKITIPTDYYYGNFDSDYTNIRMRGTGSSFTIEPNTSLYIYKAAVTEGENKAFKSAVQTLIAPNRAIAPEVTVNYEEETLSTAETMQYLKGSTWTACTANMAAIEFGWDGTEDVKVKFRKPATTGNYVSEEVEVTIPKRPDAPTGISATKASDNDASNGTITNVNDTMEYKAADADTWQPVTDMQITDLAAGSYEVRYKATSTKFASASADVNIGVVEKFTITFVNYNDEVLQAINVAFGSTPQYSGETPTKPSDDKYTYTFAGWEPSVTAVTENATYTAKFERTPIDYYVELTDEVKATVLAPKGGNCLLIFAAYDANGVVTGFELQNITFDAAGEMELAPQTLNTSGAVKIKVMLWSDISEISPKCNSDEMSLQ